MPNFSRVITLAYLRILDRLPDPEGLEHYNQLMNEGLTEAVMRESLLRSPEYAVRNPDQAGAAARATTAAAVKRARARARPAGRARNGGRPGSSGRADARLRADHP
jgi:hypothetical protein